MLDSPSISPNSWTCPELKLLVVVRRSRYSHVSSATWWIARACKTEAVRFNYTLPFILKDVLDYAPFPILILVSLVETCPLILRQKQVGTFRMVLCASMTGASTQTFHRSLCTILLVPLGITVTSNVQDWEWNHRNELNDSRIKTGTRIRSKTKSGPK